VTSSSILQCGSIAGLRYRPECETYDGAVVGHYWSRDPTKVQRDSDEGRSGACVRAEPHGGRGFFGDYPLSRKASTRCDI